MKYNLIVFLLVFMSITAPSFGRDCDDRKGNFGKGKKSDEATLRIPSMSQVIVGKKKIQIKLEKTSANFPDSDRIYFAAKEALTPEFIITDSQPEATITIAIVNYEEPVTRTYSKTESRLMLSKDKTGWAKLIPEKRDVSVEYWEGSARVELMVDVKDVSGLQIDTFSIEPPPYNVKKEINVDGVKKNEKLDTERDITRGMIENVANQLKRRYATAYHDVKVALAIDDELRNTNNMVKGDYNSFANWAGALKGWESSTIKNEACSGDRLYNMAVAYEALALKTYYDSGDPGDSHPFIIKALKYYTDALNSLPNENNIKKAQARVDAIRKTLDKAAERIIIEGTAGITASKSEAETNFRDYLRNLNSAGNFNEADKSKLIVKAQDLFSLDSTGADIVINQELKHAQALKTYEDEFKVFVGDRVLSGQERKSLSIIADRLSLDGEDIKPIENKYRFSDETKDASGATKGQRR
jgi:tetratricopeptide (TPR) repeat protein